MFLVLFVALAVAFFFSFKQRVGTFFTKHPAYRKLIDHQKKISSQKVATVFRENYPYTDDVVRDLEKINSKRKFFDTSELNLVKNSLKKLKEPQKFSNNKTDPFKNFRGAWKGEDNSLLISKDRIIDTYDKKNKLQYLEFRNPNGLSAYGLNSSFENAKVFFSRILDHKLNSIFDRIGVFINENKILWLTKSNSDEEKKTYRISIDHIMDGLLNVKSVDIDFKSNIKKVEKVNFSSYQFSRVVEY